MGKTRVLESRNYVSTATKEEIQDAVELPSPCIVLTPYKTKCSDLREQGVYGRETRMTPRQLLSEVDRAGVSHVLVEDSEVMEEFGYLEDLERLNTKGVFFILPNVQSPPSFAADPLVLPVNRYLLRLAGDERYVALFILCKIYGRVTVVCKDARRIEMFSTILGLDVVAMRHGEEADNMKVVVMMDRFVGVPCERLFYIGGPCEGLRRISLDVGKAGKYLCRIKDVCRALSRSVVSGRKELNMERFRNIDR